MRSRHKALDRLLELAVDGAARKPAHVGVMHAADPETAAEVQARLTQRMDYRDSFIAELSPVIGTRVGPGTIGISLHVD